MAWKPDYATVVELRAHLSAATAGSDSEFAAAIAAASRVIDNHCGRQFGSVAEAVERTYVYSGERMEGRKAVAVDDIHDSEGLVVELAGSTLAEGDYTLWPRNAAADGKPWTHIVFSDDVSVCDDDEIVVTASFGWASVPAVVKSAALIQASRFYVRKDASFGVAGSPELGSEIRLQAVADPDVRVMLQGVRRVWGAA